MSHRRRALLLVIVLIEQLLTGSPEVQAQTAETPRSPTLQPQRVVLAKNLSPYQLTWSNVVDRIADVSAASWTDAQLAIAKNGALPSATSHYVARITAGARAIDPELDEVNNMLKRLFALTARVPYPKHVFFVALTGDERAATNRWFKKKYPGTWWVTRAVNEMYGVNSSLPAGNPWTAYRCGGWDYARNSYNLYKGSAAASLVLGVCPSENGSDPHFEGKQGMAHEYVHTIGFAMTTAMPNQDYLPCWFMEGEPEWAQTTVASSFDDYLRAQHLHPYYLTQSGLQMQQTEAREWTKDEVQKYLRAASVRSTCAKTNQYALAYSLGAAAVEVLASISGSQAVFGFHRNLARGVGFKASFLKAFGISWAKALPTLAEAVAIKITRSWQPDALTYQTRPEE